MDGNADANTIPVRIGGDVILELAADRALLEKFSHGIEKLYVNTLKVRPSEELTEVEKAKQEEYERKIKDIKKERERGDDTPRSETR